MSRKGFANLATQSPLVICTYTAGRIAFPCVSCSFTLAPTALLRSSLLDELLLDLGRLV